MKIGDYKTLYQAQSYHQKRFSGGLSQVNTDELILLKSWLPTQVKSPIFLDLGSGTGRVIKILLEKTPRKIYALDQSDAMINFIKKKYSKQVEKKQLTTIISNSDKIPMQKNTVDFATTFHLFKHLEDIKPTLKEVLRVLKPGGYFMFDSLNKKSLVRLKLNTCYALTETQLTSILQENGFYIDRLYYLHTFGETIYNLVGNKLGHLIHYLDIFLSNNLKLGTKIFILAHKNKI